LVLKFFLQGLDPVGFFYLTGLKSSIGLLDIFGFSAASFDNSFLDIGSFWFFVAFLFIGLPDIGNSGFLPSSLFTA